MFMISKDNRGNPPQDQLGDIPNTKKNNNQEKICNIFNQEEGPKSGGPTGTAV
jgi:hypothetical protein